jgi:hypothetical protein
MKGKVANSTEGVPMTQIVIVGRLAFGVEEVAEWEEKVGETEDRKITHGR